MKSRGVFYNLASWATCVIVLVFFLGCSVSTKVENATLKLPQDSSYFLSQKELPSLPKDITTILKENYLQIWYSPWTNPEPNPDVQEVFWILPNLLRLKGYGPNLKLYTYEDLQKIYDSLDIMHYPDIAIKAIMTRDAMVRAVPTMKPFFKSRDNFPFDRWQNSLIFAGTPVLITHYDLTRQWAHIQSSFVYGWVRVGDLAKVTPQDEKFLLGIKDYVVPNRDRIDIYNDSAEFLYSARMGEIFALKRSESKNTQTQNPKEDKYYHIYLPERKPDGKLTWISAKVKREDFSPFPRKFTPAAMANVVDSMIGEFYGWGGSLESRDCSAFIRDSFANFGIFLPRNSAAQAKYADNMIDLSQMKSREKEEYIIKNATPFATILWLNGHIMLYIGNMDGKAIVAHSVWSVMTKNLTSNTENLLGGVVITTLNPESEKNGATRKAKTLLDRIIGMSDLYDYIAKFNAQGEAL